MSCGLEAYVLALQLAKEVVEPRDFGGWGPLATIAICTPVSCGGTLVESLRYQLMQAEAEDQRVKAYNAKVDELKSIIKMCEIPKK